MLTLGVRQGAPDLTGEGGVTLVFKQKSKFMLKTYQVIPIVFMTSLEMKQLVESL